VARSARSQGDYREINLHIVWRSRTNNLGVELTLAARRLVNGPHLNTGARDLTPA